MATDTDYSSQSTDVRSFNRTFELYEHLNYGYDGTNAVALKVGSGGDTVISFLPCATKITTVGDNTYIAKAPIGTAQAAAAWQAKRIAVVGGTTTITWADSNASFDNVATDLTTLIYG